MEKDSIEECLDTVKIADVSLKKMFCQRDAKSLGKVCGGINERFINLFKEGSKENEDRLIEYCKLTEKEQKYLDESFPEGYDVKITIIVLKYNFKRYGITTKRSLRMVS